MVLNSEVLQAALEEFIVREGNKGASDSQLKAEIKRATNRAFREMF